MAAYVPPHLRGKQPADAAPTSGRPGPTVVFEEAVPAYVRKAGSTAYVGPSICGNGSGVGGIGLIGRAHLKFAQPRHVIEGVIRMVSPDDSFTVAVQCTNVYENSTCGSPITGYHFCIGTLPSPNICVWGKPEDADSPLRIIVPLPRAFTLAAGTKIRFKLTMAKTHANKDTCDFRVVELVGDDNTESETNFASFLAYLPAMQSANSTVVLENRENGRLIALEQLSLDGSDLTAELEQLLSVDAVVSPAGGTAAAPRASSLQALAAACSEGPPPVLRTEHFEMDFQGAMGFQTTTEARKSNRG
jgi:hypothetical protein